MPFKPICGLRGDRSPRRRCQSLAKYSKGRKRIRGHVQALGVKHFIRSTLPSVTKLTDGMPKGMEHFDSKAGVEVYIQSMKGDTIVAYFMPGFRCRISKE